MKNASIHPLLAATLLVSPGTVFCESELHRKGFIQSWLVLGPFELPRGPSPGEQAMALDYLTDGSTTEASIRPRAGASIVPDYGNKAASMGLAPTPDRPAVNPDGVPTWIEHWDLDDTISFYNVYLGPANNVVCYAAAYIQLAREVTVNIGISSDESIQVLIDGTQVHIHDVFRGIGLPLTVQDVVEGVTLSEGCHLVLVKVFNGGGGHDFRLRFQDSAGNPVYPDTIGVSPCEPEILLRRGDADRSGELEITDAVRVLNVLFLGGDLACEDAGDADDSGSLTITDGIRILNVLFLGIGTIPGMNSCEPDPTSDRLELCAYASC